MKHKCLASIDVSGSLYHSVSPIPYCPMLPKGVMDGNTLPTTNMKAEKGPSGSSFLRPGTSKGLQFCARISVIHTRPVLFAEGVQGLLVPSYKTKDSMRLGLNLVLLGPHLYTENNSVLYLVYAKIENSFGEDLVDRGTSKRQQKHPIIL